VKRFSLGRTEALTGFTFELAELHGHERCTNRFIIASKIGFRVTYIVWFYSVLRPQDIIA